MITPVTRRSRESSLGKSPTTRVRRLIWLLSVLQALDVRILLDMKLAALPDAGVEGGFERGS